MKIVRLFGISFSLSLRQAFAYRINLVFDALMSFVQLGSSVAAIGLIFSRTGLLAGWSADQILVLVGTYTFMTGMRAAFIDPNMDDFSERARDGRLDACLLQPAPGLFLATCNRHAPVVLLQSGFGCVVIVIGLIRLHVTPSPGQILGWLLLTAIGLMIGWATTVGLACLAFWAPRLSFGVLHDAAWQFGRYPVDIYRPAMRLVLTYVFPMAAVTTWPTRALTNGPRPHILFVALGLGVALTTGAVALWRCGLRRYCGATS